MKSNGGLILGYTIAAAMEDAYALGKGDDLRRQMLPLMKQFRRDGIASPLIAEISRLLGDDWRPSGRFADRIEALHNG